MEPVRAPEAPKAPEATGPNRDVAVKAVPGRAREISPDQSPEQVPKGLVGLGDKVPEDTIIVDPRPTKSVKAGDQGPHARGPPGPEVRELQRSRRTQHQAQSAIKGIRIPRTYAKAMADPLNRAH
jgi:hypothetical protein